MREAVGVISHNQATLNQPWTTEAIAEAQCQAFEVPRQLSFDEAAVWLEQSAVPDHVWPTVVDWFSRGLMERYGVQPDRPAPLTAELADKSMTPAVASLCDRLFDSYDRFNKMAATDYPERDPQGAARDIKAVLAAVLQTQAVPSRQDYLSHLVRDRLDWQLDEHRTPQPVDEARFDRVREVVYDAGFGAMKINLAASSLGRVAEHRAAPAVVDEVTRASVIEAKSGLKFGSKALLTVVATAAGVGTMVQPAAAAISPSVEAPSSNPTTSVVAHSAAVPLVVTESSPTVPVTPEAAPSDPTSTPAPEAPSTPDSPSPAPATTPPVTESTPAPASVTPADVQPSTPDSSQTTAPLPSVPIDQASQPALVTPETVQPVTPAAPAPVPATPDQSAESATPELTADQVDNLAQGDPAVLQATLQAYAAAKYGKPATATNPTVQQQLTALEAQLATTQPADHAAFTKDMAAIRLLGQYPDLINQIKQQDDPVLGSLFAGVVGGLDANPVVADTSAKQAESLLAGDQQATGDTKQILSAALASANVQLTPGMGSGDAATAVPLTSSAQPTVVQPTDTTAATVPIETAPVSHDAVTKPSQHADHAHHAQPAHHHATHHELQLPHNKYNTGNYQKAWDFFSRDPDLRLSDVGVAALLGNFSTETGGTMNPQIIQGFHYSPNLPDAILNKLGYGLNQATSVDRQEHLKAVANRMGLPDGTMAVQLQFIKEELMNYPDLLHLLRQNNPHQLAHDAIEVEKQYERAGVDAWSSRIAYTHRVYAAHHATMHPNHNQYHGSETQGVPDDPHQRIQFFAKELGIHPSDIRWYTSSAGVWHFQVLPQAWHKLGISGAYDGYNPQYVNAPLDAYVDPSGMFSKECVSFAAFMVAHDHFPGGMPHWGGHGMAYEWAGDARAAGIPMDHKLATGAVIQWSKTGGVEHTTAGHVAYVVDGRGSWGVYAEANYDGNGGFDVQIMSPQNMQKYQRQIEILHFEKGKQGPGVAWAGNTVHIGPNSGAHGDGHDHGQPADPGQGHDHNGGAPSQPADPPATQPVQPSQPSTPSVPIDTGSPSSGSTTQSPVVTPVQPPVSQPGDPTVSNGSSDQGVQGNGNGNGNAYGHTGDQANDPSSSPSTGPSDTTSALLTMFSS